MNRIALVMIARDEARCIARCLNSARDWVDEMWLLDTGSRDGTPALAADCGAQVAHFEWQDDFALARNAALQLTHAPWRLILDADEWIAAPAAAVQVLRDELRAFCNQSQPAIGAVRVISQAEAAEGLPQEAPSWLPRLLPAGVAYAGRIHEQPDPLLPRKRLALCVHHDGYRRAQLEAKGDRNLRLLQRALSDDPSDAYMRYQLGKEFELRADFAAAQQAYALALPACPAQAGWRHDLVLRALFSLKKLRQFDRAWQLALAEMPHWQHSPDFHFTLGDLLLDWALSQPQRAAEWLPAIEGHWLRCVEIGERPDLQDSVSGRGSWLAAHNLAAFYGSLGQARAAEHWRARADQRVSSFGD